MKRSLNETRSLLKQAIEGLGAPAYLQESVGDTIAYAQEHGYANLDDQLDFLPNRLEFVAWFNKVSNGSARNAYLVETACLPMIANSLFFNSISMLATNSTVRFTIQTKGRVQHLAYLAHQLANQDFYVLMQQGRSALFCKPKQHADWFQLQVKEAESNSALSVFVSRPEIPSPLEPSQILLTEEQALAMAAQHIDQGMLISQASWRKLMSLASEVLVQASDASRLGAGE